MKNIKIILLGLIISFFMGYFLIKDYKNNLIDDITYGFLYGECNKEDLNLLTLTLSNYIYKIVDNKYEIYVGMTRNKNNIDKLKEFYIKKGYSIIVKEIIVNNDFKELIDSCDILLEKTNDYQTIEKIQNKILEYGVI